MQLEDKNVIYVGGFGGIGEKCVEAFLKSSVKSMLIFDLKPNKEYLAALKSTFKQIFIEFIPVDLTKRETIERAYKEAKDKIGTFDIVVNGAGIFNEYNIDLMVSTNLTGLIHSSLIALEYMSKAKGGQGGSIVNISSTTGLSANPLSCIYGTTKCAVINFTRSLAFPIYFNQTGVSFITICPGATATPILDNFASKVITTEYFPSFGNLFKDKINLQSAEACAQQFIKVLEKAQNGSTWVIEAGEIDEINFKDVFHPLLEGL